jgi:hypothetical protein
MSFGGQIQDGFNTAVRPSNITPLIPPSESEIRISPVAPIPRKYWRTTSKDMRLWNLISVTVWHFIAGVSSDGD